MPEETPTPVQQAPAPDQPVETPETSPSPTVQASPAAIPQPPAGYIEQARYNGLVKKVEELTLENRGLARRITELTSQNERLQGEFGVQETEKSIALGERDKLLQTATERVGALEKEVLELRALQLKLEVAKELKRPDLITLAEGIPNLNDRDALKTVMGDIARYADEAVAQREKQLLAGVTPPTSTAPTQVAVPATARDWEEQINHLPLGSKERTKLWDQYYDWIKNQPA